MGRTARRTGRSSRTPGTACAQGYGSGPAADCGISARGLLVSARPARPGARSRGPPPRAGPVAAHQVVDRPPDPLALLGRAVRAGAVTLLVQLDQVGAIGRQRGQVVLPDPPAEVQ